MKRFESLEPLAKYFSSGRCCHKIASAEKVNQKWRGTRGGGKGLGS